MTFERTPREEAIARMRESDPEGWAPVPDEQIAKLFETQRLALSIALARVGLAIRDSLPAPIGRWFR